MSDICCYLYPKSHILNLILLNLIVLIYLPLFVVVLFYLTVNLLLIKVEFSKTASEMKQMLQILSLENRIALSFT